MTDVPKMLGVMVRRELSAALGDLGEIRGMVVDRLKDLATIPDQPLVIPAPEPTQAMVVHRLRELERKNTELEWGLYIVAFILFLALIGGSRR